jgi:hypothetical protein
VQIICNNKADVKRRIGNQLPRSLKTQDQPALTTYEEEHVGTGSYRSAASGMDKI